MAARTRSGGGPRNRPKKRATRGKAAERDARSRRIALGVSVALLALVALATAAVVWLLLVYPNRPGEGHGQVVRLTLAPGLSAGEVADVLGNEHLVEDPFAFAIYLRLVGAEGHFRQGPLILARGLTPAQLSRRIAVGLGAIEVRVTIPEGYNVRDVARRLAEYQLGSEEDFLRAAREPGALAELDVPGPSLEGYLFPDTYDLRDDLPPAAILGRMVENHRRRTALLRARHAAALSTLAHDLGFRYHDVVTLASIVEKEAAVDEERPIIAGVFLNRLRSTTFQPRQRLQADPTVSYGCIAEPERAPSCARFDGRITRAMLDDEANRYNTYRHSGLPPGPIANPGLRALEAVLDPARHRYLYFVARGNRRHAFSETLEGHNTAVERSRTSGVLR